MSTHELPSGWKECSGDPENRVWRRFSKAFEFLPSTRDFPGIKERSPGRTYQLPRYDSMDEAAVWRAFTKVFRRLHRRGQTVYALDWQHTCYTVDFSAVDAGCCVSPMPNGDYHIFLEEEFRYGWFGHPWEWTVHVWGRPLLAALRAHPMPQLGTILRSS